MKKTERNRKIFCTQALEELTLLKCPYGLKQSTDSVQSLSKPCEIFFTEIEKKDPKMCVEWQKDPK